MTSLILFEMKTCMWTEKNMKHDSRMELYLTEYRVKNEKEGEKEDLKSVLEADWSPAAAA